jgi:hypothetical protein
VNRAHLPLPISACSALFIAAITSCSAAAVEVVAIQFDHEGSAALPLRHDYNNNCLKPEWLAAQRSEPALFLQGTTDATILVWLEAPPEVESAVIRAELAPIGGGANWGEVIAATPVGFSNGHATAIPLLLTRSLPAAMGLFDFELHWFADNEATTISGPHRVYTIFAPPSAPWTLLPDSPTNPWTDALDLALAQGPLALPTIEAVQTQVTRRLHHLPAFEYDIWNGSSVYATSFNYSHWRFDFSAMISDIQAGVTRVGNCYDGAASVVTFCNLLGGELHFLGSGGTYFFGFTRHSFGYLNVVDPIGRGVDYSNNPFHEGGGSRHDPIVFQDGTAGNCNRTSFGNHAFAGTQGGPGAVIWDATMKVDDDANPDTDVLFPTPEGNATSTALSASVLEDSNQDWVPDQFAGLLLNPNTATRTPNPYQEFLIGGNSATSIWISDGDLRQVAAAGDHYWIRDPQMPQVNSLDLTGIPWAQYRPLTVDANPSSNTDDPVACTLEIRAPSLTAGTPPPYLAARYGVDSWPVSRALPPAALDLERGVSLLREARVAEREITVTGQAPIRERFFFLRDERGTLRVTIARAAAAAPAHRLLSQRLCAPHASRMLAPPALPYGEERCSTLGDTAFISERGVQGSRIDLLRGNLVLRIEAEGRWKQEARKLAMHLDHYWRSLPRSCSAPSSEPIPPRWNDVIRLK